MGELRANPAFFKRELSPSLFSVFGLTEEQAKTQVLLQERASGFGRSAKLISRELSAKLDNDSSLSSFSNSERAHLILSDVLEVKTEHGYLSGPLALLALSEPDSYSLPESISKSALSFGFDLPLKDVMHMAARLYFFGRTPSHGAFVEEIAKSLDRFFLAENLPTAFRAQFEKVKITQANAWHYFRRHGVRPKRQSYKLYVCPQPNAYIATLERLLPALQSVECFDCKFGAGALGINRPDKIVLYFKSEASLKKAETELSSLLSHLPAQPLAFASASSANPLLYSAKEPKEVIQHRFREKESWRLFVANRAANYLLSIKSQTEDKALGLSALCLGLESIGICTTTWKMKEN